MFEDENKIQNAIRDKLIEEGCTVNQNGIDRVVEFIANYKYRDLNRLCDEIQKIKTGVLTETGFDDFNKGVE